MIAIKFLARGLFSVLVLAALLAGTGARAQATGEALRSDRGAWRKVPLPDDDQPYNDASFQGQTVPSAMTAGAVYSVSVAMNNIGTTTWASGASYALGSQNPQDNVTWGGGRAALGATMYPGQTATFNFQVTAPSTPGTYDFQWKMVQEGIQWFGGATPNVAVTVTAPAAVPTISVSRTPATMVAGQAFTLTWNTTNATALSRSCSASGGGYAASDAPPTSGSSSGTASAAWIGYPSTCTWSASGPGGAVTYTETMTTVGAVSGGDTVTYIHTDGLGSPVARSDANGNEISRTRYEPYGSTAAGVTPTIGFTGHVNDADTGLVYMQQRYYDPVAGRFLSIDPVTTDADTGGGFNRYAYANNSPYKYIDPDGRNPIAVGIVGGGAVLLIGAWKYATDPKARAVINRMIAGVVMSSSDGGKKDTLQPGEHGDKSVPARGPDRDFNKGERAEINQIGEESGCHTCGTKDPGTTSGNFIPDHQPPTGLNPTGGAQELYPHCLNCSRTQGGQVRGQQSRKPKPPEPKKPEKEPTNS